MTLSERAEARLTPSIKSENINIRRTQAGGRSPTSTLVDRNQHRLLYYRLSSITVTLAMPLQFSFAETMSLSNWEVSRTAVVVAVTFYVLLVRGLRYVRMAKIQRPFAQDGRPLASMTVSESHKINEELQQLEFPRAFAKARRMAQLKASTPLLYPQGHINRGWKSLITFNR